MIYEVTDFSLLKSLFQSWDETLIWSYLQGHMGQAFADHPDTPRSGRIVVADFCFFAGIPNDELVRCYPVSWESKYLILIPQTKEWERCIEHVWKEDAVKILRYATKKDRAVFDRARLETYAREIPSAYQLCMIDETYYQQVIKFPWSADFCSQFDNFEDYSKRGIGVVAVKDNQVAAGASSYTVYTDGIEIEVDTKEENRRKGLARACCARLILECLDRGIYPSWDAHNKESLALAEQLGYHFDKAYTAYEVNFSAEQK